MKIKIINGNWWYENKEGEILDDYYLKGEWYIEKSEEHSVHIKDAEVVEDDEIESADPSKVITGSEQRRRLAEKEAEQAMKLPELYSVLIGKYNLVVDKNSDYGNSFDKIMDKLVSNNIDPLQGLYIRLADKFNRFETLLFSDTQKVKDESIRDTLRDLSNYVDLYMAWEAKKDER
jgi:hypothetical protein